MNIITIVNTDWIPDHLSRFIKLAKLAMPDHKYYALIVGEEMTHPVLDAFDVVEFVPPQDDVGYLYFNRLRFSLLSRFNIDECLYIDADVDIYAPISDIPNISKAQIMACRSPVEPQGFSGLMKLIGLDDQPPWINAGMIYMRTDMLDVYDAAAEAVKAAEFEPRMIGNASFNAMWRGLPDDLKCEIPYHYGCIWWDTQSVMQARSGEMCRAYDLARTLHFCNDQGKKRRAEIDGRWVYPAQVSEIVKEQ